MVEQLMIEAQEAVNELWAEQAIPFKLTAHKVEAGEPGHYRVDFLDARLRALNIYWNPEKESFKSAVREAGKRTVGQRSRAKGAGQSRQVFRPLRSSVLEFPPRKFNWSS